MKEITIKPANNGWIVEVGCQTFVAESKQKMLNEISRYIDKPEEVEKEYTENAKNKISDGYPVAFDNQRYAIGGIVPTSI